MGRTAPVKMKCWIQFLVSRGCKPQKGTNHLKYRCPKQLRSIIFQNGKEIPMFHVRTNLKSMQVDLNKFLDWLDKNC